MSLKRLGADYECYKTSEWDVNAVKSYKAVHFENDNTDYSEPYSDIDLWQMLHKLGVSSDGKEPMTKAQLKRTSSKWKRETYNNFRATRNLGSITNISGADLEIVDKDKYEYIMFYSFPCTDISRAGEQMGFDEDSGTRSSLLWQVGRLLSELKELDQLPQVLIMENVAALLDEKNKGGYRKWLDVLDNMGYTTYSQILNCYDFALPQHRQRVIALSLLGDYNYKFPKEIELTHCIEDFYEDLTEEQAMQLVVKSEKAHALLMKLNEDGQLE